MVRFQSTIPLGRILSKACQINCHGACRGFSSGLKICQCMCHREWAKDTVVNQVKTDKQAADEKYRWKK